SVLLLVKPCGSVRPLARASSMRVGFVGALAFSWAPVAAPSYRPGCRSSVVEHSLGKGEVESSIPSGSTRFSIKRAEPVGTPAGHVCRANYCDQFEPLEPFSSEVRTWSIEKLPGFCRGGNSLNVARNFAT